MKHKILHLGLFLPVFFLSACSVFFTPSEEKGRKVLEAKLEQTENPIDIIQFKKVNGQSGEKKGIEFYNLKFKAQLEYPEGLNTECIDPPEGMEALNCIGAIVRKPGKKESITGEMYFEQTEKGWKMKNMNTDSIFY